MFRQIHPDTMLGEVKLNVSNLERSIAFYQEVIGLKVLQQEGNTARFTVDGKTVILVLEEVVNAVTLPPRTTTGLYHFAILVPTRKDLGLALRNLIRNDIHIGQSDHTVSEALYISDPDLNGIEIYRDKPRETWTRDEQGYYVMGLDPIDWEGLLQEAGNEPWTGMVPGTRIGHVHLHIADIEASKTFYHRILGFDITSVYHQSTALFVSAGGYHHHLGLNIWAGAGAPQPPKNATGIAYFTIVLPSDTELNAILHQLEANRIAAQKHEGYWFVEDPVGNGIRLMVKAQ